MPTPVSTAKQCLTSEAAITLDDAVVVAARRGHAQTTSLHLVSSLLSLPSSTLREACTRTRNNAYSTRIQFKALELCLGVSLDRLPSSTNRVDDPPVSNSLMAAVKRSQANQRRQPENFSFYQQQQQSCSSFTSSSTVPVVKVELQNLILSILDDPVVSRVFGEAGFRSSEIKLAIIRPVNQLFKYSRFRGPPLFLCNLNGENELCRRNFSFPFMGFSGVCEEDDSCKRIGEVLVKNKGKNPLLLGTFANSAMNNFLRMVERNRGEGNLPVELCGLSVICIESEVLRFVTGECDEELVKLKFEEIGAMVEHCIGACVLVNYGDLKAFARDDASIDAGRYLVSKLTNLIEVHGGKLRLIGSSARYETFLKVLNRFPYIEKDWDLQLLTITSPPPKEESYSRSSLMESFVPFGGFFSTPDDIKSPLSCSYQTVSRCHFCNEKCKQEVNALSKGGFSSVSVSVADQYQSSLPSWLQMTELETNGAQEAMKANDDKMVLGAKIAGLQRKWDNLCQRLHCNQPSPKTSTFLLGSQLPSIVGFHVLEDKKESINNENSVRKNPSSADTVSKNLNSCMSMELPTISSSKENSPLCMTSEANNVNFLSKLSETPSNREDERGLNSRPFSLSSSSTGDARRSPTSVTSVTTDLGLGMASTSLSPSSSSQDIHRQSVPKDFKMLYRALMEKVEWQEEAVNVISQTLARCRTRNERKHGTNRGDIWLNFLGPDTLGKKKVAIALTEILYGSTNNLLCMDLSLQDDSFCNMKSMYDLQVLNGYDVKFRGKNVVDYVADKLRNNPMSLVFLENVDKADLQVQNSLSQAVKTGRFSDSHGREVGVGNAIFVTTSRLAEERILPCTKNTSNYSEDDVLAAKGWQIQILVAFDLGDDVTSPNSGTLITTRKRSSIPRENVEQCGNLEMAKRAHKASNTCLDLNLPAEESETSHTCYGDCECDFANENSTAWMEHFFAQVDETVIFRPFDFDALAEKLLKEVRICFHRIIGPDCLLEIHTTVVEQILAAACLTGCKKVEDWIQHVLSRGFVEAQERYSLSARSVVKLVNCESRFSEEHKPGDLLPGKIKIN